jgi:hypothetical protein
MLPRNRQAALNTRKPRLEAKITISLSLAEGTN